MTFDPGMFANFIAEPSPVHGRVSPSYTGASTEFDIIIIGSGMGGGVLADELADRIGTAKRILVLEAGSHLYPTHVYNCSRLPNYKVAQRFGCSTFWQDDSNRDVNYIHERPQLNLGGRSIFWSGLIPAVQPWELAFFPERVRAALAGGLLDLAGERMNAFVSLGETARIIRDALRASRLSDDFDILETPRALHQPYLQPGGVPASEFFREPTGVFNTAELLINQLGLSSDQNSGGDGGGLRLLLNSYVEDIRRLADRRIELVARHTVTGQARSFQAGSVVLAGGSIESPKLLARSTLGRSLPDAVTALIGHGLTDHPTTAEIHTLATHIGDKPIPRSSLAKIIFYSRGKPGADGRIKYPFNVEMNVNHEYWHLRENDPSAPETPIGMTGDSIVDIKFSFGNCLDPSNEIRRPPPFGYVPEIRFRSQSSIGYLAETRFPALAGWTKSPGEIYALLNEITARIFAEFRHSGVPCKPLDGERYGENRGFGWGTVHHAAGTLRMPFKERHDSAFANGVVDEDLRVVGAENLYVCDMSVMPFASAANPVRTLVALALRLAERLDVREA